MLGRGRPVRPHPTTVARFPSAGKDPETGFGLVDARAAVNAVLLKPAAPLYFPPTVSGRETVPDNSEVTLTITVVDSTQPLAVTLTLDGRDGRQGWSPDLDAQVLDAAGNPLTLPGVPPEWGLVPAGSLSTWFYITAIKPLPMIGVADQLGIHVGTVSRAVADKWVQTPRGLIPLRSFFTGGTAPDSGETVSWPMPARP